MMNTVPMNSSNEKPQWQQDYEEFFADLPYERQVVHLSILIQYVLRVARRREAGQVIGEHYIDAAPAETDAD